MTNRVFRQFESTSPTPILLIGLVAFVSVSISACTGSGEINSPDAGRTLVYEPGLPNFDMEAIPTWRDDQAGIDLYVGLPYASLIFLQQGADFQAGYEATIEIYPEGEKIPYREESWDENVVVSDYDQTQSFKSISIQKRFLVDPGTYDVVVTFEDTQSKKTAERRQRIEVADLSSGELSASRILLEGRSPDGLSPLIAYHQDASYDSLRAVIELYNADVHPSVEVYMTLVEYETDSEPAEPPFWFSPNAGSLGYRGIRRGAADTLQITRQSLSNLSSEIIVEFNLPKLDPGLFNIHVEVTAPGLEEPVFQGERQLSVKAPGFPRLETFEQLVEALVYIADRRELRDMLESDSVEEMQVKFDAFWGERMPSRQAGQNAIRQYYSRVEEANLFFTNYKEGWKTDRGMVYILLGAPVFVEDQFESEIWRYSYGSNDPLSVFIFRKTRPLGDKLQNYVLQRSPIYEIEWRKRIDRWREGMVY